MTAQPKAAPRPVILVVEDEPIVRLVARDILEDAGFEVLEADTADEAVGLLDGGAQVEVLFTDVHTPGNIDGLMLARMAGSRWPGLRVAVTSGRARPCEGELPRGVMFVPKPYRADELAGAAQMLASEGSAS